jgi:hypothetical protein
LLLDENILPSSEVQQKVAALSVDWATPLQMFLWLLATLLANLLHKVNWQLSGKFILQC